MKKFVFVLTIVLVCMMLVSCGSAQKRGRNGRAVGSLNWHKAEEKMNWDNAKDYCDEHEGRLPTTNELLTIYREANHQSVFGDTDAVWSSEEFNENENRARTVEFSFGRVEVASKNTKYKVYCVR